MLRRRVTYCLAVPGLQRITPPGVVLPFARDSLNNWKML